MALPVHNNSSSAGNAGASSLSWTHTCSGTDRYLKVGVSIASSTVVVTGVTFNGDPLSPLEDGTVSGGPIHGEYWYMVNPDAATGLIVVTLSGSAAVVGGASSYTGVHQTTPHGPVNVQTGTSNAAGATVTSSTDQLVTDVLALRTGATGITVGGSQTQRWNRLAAGTPPTGTLPTGAGSERAGGALTTAMSWTVNDATSKAWVQIGVALRPSGTGLKLIIAGTDRTTKYICPQSRRGMRISMGLGSDWTASFPVYDNDDTSSAFRASIDQLVEIQKDGTRIFYGKITKAADRPRGGSSNGVVTEVTAKAGTELTDQVELNATYDGGFTLHDHVATIVAGLSSFDITLDPGMATGPTLGPVVFDRVLVADGLNYLTAITGYVWRKLPTGILECFLPGTKTASFSLTAANNKALGPILWEQTAGTRINRVHLRYGTDKEVEKTDVFTGDGSTRTFPLTYRVATRPGVLTESDVLAGAFQNVGEYVAGTFWRWNFDTTVGAYGGLRVPTEAPPGTPQSAPTGGGTPATITATYAAQFPNVVTVEDAADIAANGLWERTIDAPDVYEYEGALEMAEGLLRQYTTPPKRVTARTREGLEYPGTVMTLTFADRTISGTFLITHVDISDYKKDGLEYSYTLVEGTENMQSWTDLLKGALGGAPSRSGGSVSGEVLPTHAPIYITNVIVQGSNSSTTGGSSSGELTDRALHLRRDYSGWKVQNDDDATSDRLGFYHDAFSTLNPLAELELFAGLNYLIFGRGTIATADIGESLNRWNNVFATRLDGREFKSLDGVELRQTATIANLGTLDLPAATRGFLFVVTRGNDAGACFLLRGASNSVVEVLDPLTSFTTTSGAAAFNVFYNAGTTSYRLENRTGSSLVVEMFLVGTGML
jgi:hypothetical protein